MKAAWAARARCRGFRHLFFQEDEASLRRARAFCAGCPVWFRCLATALNHAEEFGVWGGLRPGERRRLQRLRGRLVVAPDDPANRADVAWLVRVMPPERLAEILGVEPQRRVAGPEVLAG